MNEQFLDFIGDIYEASYRPELWESVFANLCAQVNAKSGGIFLWDHANDIQSIVACFGLPKLAQLSYRLGLAKYDHSYNLMVEKEVGQAQHILTHQEMRKTNPLFYRFLLKPNDVGYVSGINLHKDEELYIGMAIHRGLDAEPFGKQELEILQLSYPHFQRAIRIQMEFQRIKQKQQSLNAALSHLSLGVVILDKDGLIAHCNPVAEAIIAPQQVLTRNHNRLVAYYPEEQQQLQQQINDLLKADPQDIETRTRALALQHPERQIPLTVMISKIDGNNSWVRSQEERQGIAVYLSDPQTALQTSPERLKSLYQLTQAEAKVAISIANGLDLQEVADFNSTTIGTVRSQLRQIFTKMGVNKQQDVVRLLLHSAHVN